MHILYIYEFGLEMCLIYDRQLDKSCVKRKAHDCTYKVMLYKKKITLTEVIAR